MKFNTFYSNEFIYNGFKILMVKAGGTQVFISIFPEVDDVEFEKIKQRDPALYQKINTSLHRFVKSTTYDFGGAFNPNFEIAVAYAKTFVDNNLGTFDVRYLKF